jgi:hypothetical protein
MNYAKIGAALHALADAILEDAGTVAAEPPKKGRGKAAEAQAQAPAGTPAVQLEPVAPVAPTPPPVQTISKAELNKAVLKVAAKSRDAAEAILSKFGAKNTVTLPEDQWQAVYDAFEEEIAKMDAAAVQVAQASLV